MSKDLFYEIGTEEIPARFINNAIKDIENILEEKLKSLRLNYSEIKIFATPRRFAILIKNLDEKQSNHESEVKGPAKKICIDPEGNPSKALIGFVKSKNGSLENVEYKMSNDELYGYLKIFEKGEQAEIFFKDILDKVIRKINFPKPMRWGNKNIKFIRPIRWLVCIFGNESQNFDIEGIQTSNITKGHRFLGEQEISIKNFEDYIQKLEKNYVVLDHHTRKEIIKNQVIDVAKSIGGQAIIDEEILDEVNFIVEYPTAFYGEFSPSYLDLPKEAIVTPMQNHQRYFPVTNDNDELMNYFITVRNGDSHMIDNVRKGNQKVLDARLSDAEFFYNEDIKKPLESYVENLKTIVFHQQLGTMYDKVQRLMITSVNIADILGYKSIFIMRTAELAKADLTTAMVFEFGELQGSMGYYYASFANEPKEVCHGIFEHYLPRKAGDILPCSEEGIAVSLADKIDTITGFFAIGIQPSGSQDPYALRRQGIGILSTMIERELPLTCQQLIAIGCENLPVAVGSSALEDVNEFMRQRLVNLMLNMNIRYDVVNAVSYRTDLAPYKIIKLAQALVNWLSEDKSLVLAAFIRGNNLLKNIDVDPLNVNLFEHEAEQRLFDRISDIKSEVDSAAKEGDYLKALLIGETIAPHIDYLFDNVMVMHENKTIKNNRLMLIREAVDLIANLFNINEIIYK